MPRIENFYTNIIDKFDITDDMIKEIDNIEEKKWLIFPEDGTIKIYPFDIFEKKSFERIGECPLIYNCIDTPKSLIKLDKYTITDYKSSPREIYTSKLRVIVPMICDNNDIKTCGVKVEDCIKKLYIGKPIIFDCYKKWAIYNKSDDDIIMLFFDITRPKNIPYKEIYIDDKEYKENLKNENIYKKNKTNLLNLIK